MMPSKGKSKAFVQAVRSGKDYGDGTSSANPTTQPGQLLKALVMKNAAGTRPGGGNVYEDARGGSYKATPYPQRIVRLSVAAMSGRPVRRHAATARQILKMSKRK